ncbi:hypothetical protein PQX77_008713 [Marasmius sp. AFHP31]|nr:hypothetical protein PQX77_008713 [Marasmius sp. AFHP31]
MLQQNILAPCFHCPVCASHFGYIPPTHGYDTAPNHSHGSNILHPTASQVVQSPSAIESHPDSVSPDPPGPSQIKGKVVATPSETKTHSDTHNLNIFSNIDDVITDGHYWCSLGPARLVRTEDLVNEWDKSPQGHYHAHVSWDVAKQLDDFKVDWSTRTDTAKHTSLAIGMLSETIDGGYCPKALDAKTLDIETKAVEVDWRRRRQR